MYQAPDTVTPIAAQSDDAAGVLNVYNLRSWWNAILAEPLENFEKRASLY